MSAEPLTSNFESQDTSRCQTAPLCTSYVPASVPPRTSHSVGRQHVGREDQVAVPVVDDTGDGALVALEEDGAHPVHMVALRLASGACSPAMKIYGECRRRNPEPNVAVALLRRRC